jgi:hypothetical protein
MGLETTRGNTALADDAPVASAGATPRAKIIAAIRTSETQP